MLLFGIFWGVIVIFWLYVSRRILLNSSFWPATNPGLGKQLWFLLSVELKQNALVLGKWIYIKNGIYFFLKMGIYIKNRP